MKLLLVFLLASLAGLAGGCVVHAHGEPYGGVVVVEPGHVHHDACGHYYYRDRWYVSHGHRHGPGCGHAWRGGVWIRIH